MENTYKINGIIKKFSLIKNLNLSRINIKELQRYQDLNQESHQDSNTGNSSDLHIYIKVFLVFMKIATCLYIIKLVFKCFKLKSKCNFDFTAGKKKTKINNTSSQNIDKINTSIIIEDIE